MDLIIIVLGIIAMVCFYEYNHLSKNNIRHDERIYLILGVAFVILMCVLIYLNPYAFSSYSHKEQLGD